MKKTINASERKPKGELSDVAFNFGKTLYCDLASAVDTLSTLGMIEDDELKDVTEARNSRRNTRYGAVGSALGHLGLLACVGAFAWAVTGTLSMWDEAHTPTNRIEIYNGHGKPMVTIYNATDEDMKSYRGVINSNNISNLKK